MPPTAGDGADRRGGSVTDMEGSKTMTRNLKVLGLFVAMLAISALSASGAWASGEQFHATREHVIVTGETEPETGGVVFDVGKGKVICAKGRYEGTVTGTSTEGGQFTTKEVTVHPTAEECKLAGVNATLNTNGCNYALTSGTSVTTTEPVITEHARVSFECTVGAQITFSGSGCKIRLGTENEGSIPEETLADGVKYFNKNTGVEEITVAATVKNIPYEAEGALCGVVGIETGKHHDGMYTDHVTVKAYGDENGPCTQNTTTHKLETCNEGSQVSIHWG